MNVEDRLKELEKLVNGNVLTAVTEMIKTDVTLLTGILDLQERIIHLEHSNKELQEQLTELQIICLVPSGNVASKPTISCQCFS